MPLPLQGAEDSRRILVDDIQQNQRRPLGGLDVNFHDLRHSCASLLINMGTPLEVVRGILGQTTVKTTERYAHVHVDRQAEALHRLSAAVLK